MVMWLGGSATIGAAPAEEDALLGLWQYHETATDHGDSVAAAEAFEKQFPRSTLLPVSRSLVGWHRLHRGESTQVEELFGGLRSSKSDPFSQSADRIARSWLTRLDRERVKIALRSVYAKTIAYPARFPASIQPATDRWDKPWIYRLQAMRFIKGVSNQTYHLESPTLGATSDLRVALKIPFGSRIALTPVRRDGEAVTFQLPGKPDQYVLVPGSDAGETRFVHLGERILVLADRDHWRVLATPKK